MTFGNVIREISGKNHDVFIDPTARLDGSRLRVKDNGCSVHIGAGVTGKWDLSVSQGGRLFIGRGTTCETALIVAQSRQVVVGDDCMLSFSIEIRNTDTHAIYDITTGERVNVDQDVEIGDHVWIGKQGIVLKGTTIGAGAVIGTRAVVSGIIPPMSVSVGIPARVVRESVTWTRKIGAGVLEADANAMAAITSVRSRN